MYASEAENTNLPLVMSTCPPPKLTAYRPFFTEARMAFVVDRKGAAPAGNGAVIHDGDSARRDFFSDLPGEGGGTLAVEVALKAVADRFVQENARPAWPEHHGHGARRRRARFEIDERLVGRVFRVLLQPLLGEVAVVAAPAAARRALLAPAVLLDDHLHGEPHERPNVRRLHAVRARHQHHLVFGAEVRHDLDDARIARAAELLQALEQLHFLHVFERGERVDRLVELEAAAFSNLRGMRTAARARNSARRLGRILERRQ